MGNPINTCSTMTSEGSLNIFSSRFNSIQSYQCFLYLFVYSFHRFSPEQRNNAVWIHERCHEAYAKNYSVAFPHDQPLSGRNLKLDPFHSVRCILFSVQ